MLLCKIADLFVSVPTAGGLSSRCAEYVWPSEAKTDIVIHPELYRTEKYDPRLPENTVPYMESAYQFCRALIGFEGFYLHSSAVEVDGKAYLFSGPCGMGKSTHTRIWQQVFGEKAQVFNDDKPALRLIDGRWYAYGTPWCGKDGININMKVPLAGICFLKQAPNNRIRRLDSMEAFSMFMTQTLRKELTAEEMAALLQTTDHLIREIPIFELENRPEPAAAQLSYETMRRAAEEAGL